MVHTLVGLKFCRKWNLLKEFTRLTFALIKGLWLNLNDAIKCFLFESPLSITNWFNLRWEIFNILSYFGEINRQKILNKNWFLRHTLIVKYWLVDMVPGHSTNCIFLHCRLMFALLQTYELKMKSDLTFLMIYCSCELIYSIITFL